MTARGDRRAERAAADEQSAALSLEYELGEERTRLRREHPRGQRTVGCMLSVLAAVAILVALPLAGTFGPGIIILVIPVAVAGALAGFGLWRAALPPRVDWTFCYTGGIAQVIGGEPGPRVIPWAMLDSAAHVYASDEDGTVLCGVTLTSLDGTEISAGPTSTMLGTIAGDVDAILVAARLRAAREQLASGAPLAFGDITLSGEGIAWPSGARWLAWRDLRRAEIKRYEARLAVGGWRSQVISMSAVPDSCVLLLLIQDIIARLGVRQDGRPLAVPGLPPADERLAALRNGMLSEMDVSEILGRPVRALMAPGSQMFRGENVTIALVPLGSGKVAAMNRNYGRRNGRRVTSLGDEAWLVSGDRSLVVTTPAATFKILLSGSAIPQPARAAILIPLAQLALSRMPAPGLTEDAL